MKHILIHLDDETYEKLIKKKGDKSWEQFLIQGGKTV